jgi:hypothetical protein
MSARDTDRASTHFHSAAELSAAEQFLVPAMREGVLTLSAGGHSITLLPGRLSERLADELAQQLRLEELRREAEAFTRGGAV